MVLLGVHEELLVLLYFGSLMVVLTADPNVEASGLDSGFAAHHRSGLMILHVVESRDIWRPRHHGCRSKSLSIQASTKCHC